MVTVFRNGLLLWHKQHFNDQIIALYHSPWGCSNGPSLMYRARKAVEEAEWRRIRRKVHNGGGPSTTFAACLPEPGKTQTSARPFLTGLSQHNHPCQEQQWALGEISLATGTTEVSGSYYPAPINQIKQAHGYRRFRTLESRM